MGAIDTAILFAYLGLMIGLGIYANYKQKDVDDYFVAGRRMGALTIACLWMAAWVGGAAVVGSAARNGTLLAVLFMIPLAVASVWLGLASAVLFPDAVSSNGILTTFVLELFPVGLKGLVLVAILAAVMSSADICILTASANYTRDIHQRFIQPGIRPRSMLRLSILSSVVAGALATMIAWKMQDIIGALQLGFTINSAGLFLPTIAAMYLKRVDATAAFWSICTSLATVILWRFASAEGLGGVFEIDPLWPGLLVSAIVLLGLSLMRQGRQHPAI